MPLKNKQTLTAFIGKVLDTGGFSLVVKILIGGILYCLCALLYWCASKNEMWKAVCGMIRRK